MSERSGAPARYAHPGARTQRCKTCEGCTAVDCRLCKPCLDMPKYGGQGGLKQCCIKRQCVLIVSEKVRLARGLGTGYTGPWSGCLECRGLYDADKNAVLHCSNAACAAALAAPGGADGADADRAGEAAAAPRTAASSSSTSPAPNASRSRTRRVCLSRRRRISTPPSTPSPK